ncbi:MAG TPA: hypothetical protein VH877_28125 [Polyangia bacterium]|nr:hypothetical protein [Polyangia bacterium]
MRKTLWLSLASAGLAGLLLAATATSGCKSDGGSNNPDLGGGIADLRTPPDLVASPDLAPTCFQNPTTHDEFINSCPPAGVEQVEKSPTLPLLNSDGSLPPLP